MPEPMRTSTSPSTSSAISASRTDGRDTPSCLARSRSGGKPRARRELAALDQRRGSGRRSAGTGGGARCSGTAWEARRARCGPRPARNGVCKATFGTISGQVVLPIWSRGALESGFRRVSVPCLRDRLIHVRDVPARSRSIRSTCSQARLFRATGMDADKAEHGRPHARPHRHDGPAHARPCDGAAVSGGDPQRARMSMTGEVEVVKDTGGDQVWDGACFRASGS